MSFKREGDDTALLNNLQHRRVAELLGNHIPDTEASLLSNGRLTCLVCSFRPIFDTISMLAVHRQGKKHIHELSKYLHRKMEIETRALKATQTSHIMCGLTTTEPAMLGQQMLRTPGKNRRFGLGQRKHIMEPTSPAANVLISSPEQPSASSQVRKYLKNLERQKPLQKTMDRCRENYGNCSKPQDELSSSASSMSPASTCGSEQEHQLGARWPASSEPAPLPAKAAVSIPEVGSGWRLRKDGGLEKDPDAEFDSEDDL